MEELVKALEKLGFDPEEIRAEITKQTEGWSLKEKAAFFAHSRHETNNYKWLRERKTKEGKFLGTYSGGPAFHGKGVMQLSHDYNHRDYGQDTYNDPERFIKNPDAILDTLQDAVGSGVWYWQKKVKPRVKDDWDNIDLSTEVIHGKAFRKFPKSLENRKNLYIEELERLQRLANEEKPEELIISEPAPEPTPQQKLELTSDFEQRKNFLKLDESRLKGEQGFVHGPLGDLYRQQVATHRERVDVLTQPIEGIQDRLDAMQEITGTGAVHPVDVKRIFEYSGKRPFTKAQENIVKEIRKLSESGDPDALSKMQNLEEQLLEERRKRPYVGNQNEEKTFLNNELASKAAMHLKYVEALNPELLAGVKDKMQLNTFGVPQNKDVVKYLLSPEFYENIAGGVNTIQFLNLYANEDAEKTAIKIHRFSEEYPALFDPYPGYSNFRYGLDDDLVAEYYGEDYGGKEDKLSGFLQDFTLGAYKEVGGLVEGIARVVSPDANLYHFHRVSRNRASIGEIGGKMASWFAGFGAIYGTTRLGLGMASVARTGKPLVLGIKGKMALTSFSNAAYLALTHQERSANAANMMESWLDDDNITQKLWKALRKEDTDGDFEGALKDVISFLPFDTTAQIIFGTTARMFHYAASRNQTWSQAAIKRHIRKYYPNASPEVQDIVFNHIESMLSGGNAKLIGAAPEDAGFMRYLLPKDTSKPVLYYRGKAIPISAESPLASYGLGGNVREVLSGGLRIPSQALNDTTHFYSMGLGPIDDSIKQALSKNISDAYNFVARNPNVPLAQLVSRMKKPGKDGKPPLLTENEMRHSGLRAFLKQNPNAKAEEILEVWKDAQMDVLYSQSGYNHTDLFKVPFYDETIDENTSIALQSTEEQIHYQAGRLLSEFAASLPKDQFEELKNQFSSVADLRKIDYQGPIDDEDMVEIGSSIFNTFDAVGVFDVSDPKEYFFNTPGKFLKLEQELEDLYKQWLMEASDLVGKDFDAIPAEAGAPHGGVYTGLHGGPFHEEVRDFPDFRKNFWKAASSFKPGKRHNDNEVDIPHLVNPGQIVLQWRENLYNAPYIKALTGVSVPEGLFPKLPSEMIFGKGGVHAGPRAMAHSRHGEELHENFGEGHVIQEVQKDASSEIIRLKKHLTSKGDSKEAIEKRIEEVKYPAYGKEEELLILNNARIAALNDMDYIRIATGTEQSGSRVSSPKTQIMYSSKGPANQALKKLAKKIGLEQKVIPISEQGKAEKVQLKKIIDEHVEPMLEDIVNVLNTDQAAFGLTRQATIPIKIESAATGHLHHALLKLELSGSTGSIRIDYKLEIKDKVKLAGEDYPSGLMRTSETIIAPEKYQTIEVFAGADRTKYLDPDKRMKLATRTADRMNRDWEAEGWGAIKDDQNFFLMTDKAKQWLLDKEDYSNPYKFYSFPGQALDPERWVDLIKKAQVLGAKISDAFRRGDTNLGNALQKQISEIYEEMQGVDPGLFSSQGLDKFTIDELLQKIEEKEWSYIKQAAMLNDISLIPKSWEKWHEGEAKNFKMPFFNVKTKAVKEFTDMLKMFIRSSYWSNEIKTSGTWLNMRIPGNRREIENLLAWARNEADFKYGSAESDRINEQLHALMVDVFGVEPYANMGTGRHNDMKWWPVQPREKKRSLLSVEDPVTKKKINVQHWLRPMAKALGIPKYSKMNVTELWEAVTKAYEGVVLFHEKGGKEALIDSILEANYKATESAINFDEGKGMSVKDKRALFTRGLYRTRLYRLLDGYNQARVAQARLLRKMKEEGLLSEKDQRLLQGATQKMKERADVIYARTQGKIDPDELSEYKGEGAIERFMAENGFNPNLPPEQIKTIAKQVFEKQHIEKGVAEVQSKLEEQGFNDVFVKGKDDQGRETIQVREGLSEEEATALSKAVEDADRKALQDTAEQVGELEGLDKGIGEIDEIILKKNEETVKLRNDLREAQQDLSMMFAKWQNLKKASTLTEEEAAELVSLDKKIKALIRKNSILRNKLEFALKDVSTYRHLFYKKNIKTEDYVADLEIAMDRIALLNQKIDNLKKSNGRYQMKLSAFRAMPESSENTVWNLTMEDLWSAAVVHKHHLSINYQETIDEIIRLESELAMFPKSELMNLEDEIAQLGEKARGLEKQLEDMDKEDIHKNLSSKEEEELITLKKEKASLIEAIARLEGVKSPSLELENLEKDVLNLQNKKKRLTEILENPDLTREEVLEKIAQLKSRMEFERKVVESYEGDIAKRADVVLTALERKLQRLIDLNNILDTSSGLIDPLAQSIQRLQRAIADAKKGKAITETQSAKIERAYYNFAKLYVGDRTDNIAKLTRSRSVPSEKVEDAELLEWSRKNKVSGRFTGKQIVEFIGDDTYLDTDWSLPQNRQEFIDLISDNKFLGDGSLAPKLFDINKTGFFPTMKGFRRLGALALQARLSGMVTSPQTATLALVSAIVEVGLQGMVRNLYFPFAKTGKLSSLPGLKYASNIPVINKILDKRINWLAFSKEESEWYKFMEEMDKFGDVGAIEKAPRRNWKNFIGTPIRKIGIAQNADEGPGVSQASLASSAQLQSGETITRFDQELSLQNIDLMTEWALGIKNPVWREFALQTVNMRTIALREGIGNVDHYIQLAGLPQAMKEAVANVYSTYAVYEHGIVTPKQGYEVLRALTDMESALITGEISGAQMREFLSVKLTVPENNELIDLAMQARAQYLDHIKVPSLTQKPKIFEGLVRQSDKPGVGHLTEFMRAGVNALDLNLQRMGPFGYLYSKATGRTDTPMEKAHAKGRALTGALVTGLGTWFLWDKFNDYFRFDEYGGLQFKIKKSKDQFADIMMRVANATPEYWSEVLTAWNEVNLTTYNPNDKEDVKKFLLKEVLTGDEERYVYYSVQRFSNIDALIRVAAHIKFVYQGYAPGVDPKDFAERGVLEHTFNLIKELINTYGGQSIVDTLNDVTSLIKVDTDHIGEQAQLILADLFWVSKGLQNTPDSIISQALPPYMPATDFRTDKERSSFWAGTIFAPWASKESRVDAAGDPLIRDSFSYYTFPKAAPYTDLQQIEKELGISFAHKNPESVYSDWNRLDTAKYKGAPGTTYEGKTLYYATLEKAQTVKVGGVLMKTKLKRHWNKTSVKKDMEEIRALIDRFKDGELRKATEEEARAMLNRYEELSSKIKNDFYQVRNKYIDRAARLMNLEEFKDGDKTAERGVYLGGL